MALQVAYTSSMPRSSIFDGIVSDENDYSKLLCNLLNRSEKFRAAFLVFIHPNATSHDDFKAVPHSEHEEGGIPDITIRFASGTEHFIEVKANSYCPTTYYQNRAYGEPNSLTFLVPVGYCRETPPGVERRFWNDLSSVIRNSEELSNNQLIQEFRMLINQKFPCIQLEPDEARALGSCDKKALASLVLALPRVVDALQAHFDGMRVCGKELEADPDSEDDEYGFNIKVDNRPLLWVGIWRSEGLLLAAAYELGWQLEADLPEFSTSRSEYGDGYKVFSLDGLVLGGTADIVSGAVGQLESILQRIITAQHS
jgi:hypothetical protein